MAATPDVDQNQPVTRGIDPKFAKEIAERRAKVEQLRDEAEKAWVEYRSWVLTEWLENERGSAQEIAKAMGITKTRLYQVRDNYLAAEKSE